MPDSTRAWSFSNPPDWGACLTEHLSREFLDQIATGEREVAELATSALTHLLEICPTCHRAVEAWRDEAAGDSCQVPHPGRSPSSEVPESTFLRLDTVLRRPESEWLPALRQEFRSRSVPSIAEELLKRVWDFLPGQPLHARSLAALAGVLIRHASSASTLTPLYALSLAHQANAARVEEDLGHAEELMETARFILREEHDEQEPWPLILSGIDWLEGSLRRAQRRLDEAELLFIRSAKTCFETGLHAEAAQRLLSLCNVYSLKGASIKNDLVIRRACGILQRSDSHPRLILLGLHSHVHLLARSSRPMEARHLFGRIQDLYLEVPEPAMHLRRIWADGLILQQEGWLRRAEDRFREAKAGFLGRDLHYIAAMVAKDLAALYVQQRRLRDLEATIDEIIPVFETKGVQYEVDAARKILRNALGSRREVN